MKTNRNFWPYGLIAVFVLFFAGMASVITIAITHREYLVSDNYYEQELNYQTQIDGAARAKSAGAAIRFDADAQKLVIALPPSQYVQKAGGKVEFYRPSAVGLDRHLALQPAADGTQTLSVSDMATGPWALRVSWQADGQGYYLEQKFVVAAK